MEDVEYPVLGEHLAVDLANSWYSSGDESTDYLETPGMAREWWEVVVRETPAPVTWPSDWTSEEHSRLVALRDAVRDVLLCVARSARPEPVALATINSCAKHAPVGRSLAPSTDRRSSALVVLQCPGADGVTGVLGLLADSCIGLFGADDVPPVRRCEGPRCPMLFIRHHRHRRYCHASCAQRGRQARYYQRNRAKLP